MIHFHYEDIKPKKIGALKSLRHWISTCVSEYGYRVDEVNIIFCSDEYLLNINQEHLNHDYYTDIITFNFNEERKLIGDLYISYDRVKENAKKEKVSLRLELYRVIIHGILHLCGLNDKSEKEQKEMRRAENTCLKKLIVPRET